MSRNKGFKHSEETKRNISKSRNGNNNNGFKRGHKHSKETKEKMKQIKLKNPSRYWLGKKRDKDTNEKISKTLKTKFSEGVLKPVGHSNKNKPSWNKGLKTPKKTREKQRIKAIQRIQNGVIAKTSNTDIEIIMKDKLKELGLNFIHQYNFNNIFVCDFYLPEMNTIIECDGEYWHNLPQNRKRDGYKRISLRKKYRLLRFSSKMIKKQIEDCVSVIFDKEIVYFDWRHNWEIKLLGDPLVSLDTIKNLEILDNELKLKFGDKQ